MRLLHILTCGLLLFCAKPSSANEFPSYKQELFIETWANMAVEQMERHGIPASITLAQAIVESGWGEGYVARQANNYFCIKGNNGWDGPVVKAQDDDPDSSSFRQYTSIEESFTDHSKFLLENNRYKPLFELSIYDYRSWAIGLKQCGYATKSDYAEYLISTIEKYGLYMYDYAAPEAGGSQAVPSPTAPAPLADVPVINPAQIPQPAEAPQPRRELQPIENQEEGKQHQAENGGKVMEAPKFHFDKDAAAGIMSAPQVNMTVEGKPINIPLMMPKATMSFDRR